MSWAGVAAAAAVTSAGVGVWGASQAGKGDPEDYLVYKQLPDYKESEQARGTWADMLQQWKNEPGYGAITADWEDIFNKVQTTVNQYLYGKVGEPGALDIAGTSAANRKASADIPLLLTGFKGAELGKDMLMQETFGKLGMMEQGRRDWLQSIMNLAGQKPSFVTGTGPVSGGQSYNLGAGLSDVFSGVSNITSDIYGQQQQKIQQQKQLDYLNDMLKKMGIFGDQETGLVSSYGAAQPSQVNKYLLEHNIPIYD